VPVPIHKPLGEIRSACNVLFQNTLGKPGASGLSNERSTDGKTAFLAGWPFTFSMIVTHKRKYSSSFDASPLQELQLGTVIKLFGRGFGKRFRGGM
jgi:hypothetical protein